MLSPHKWLQGDMPIRRLEAKDRAARLGLLRDYALHDPVATKTAFVQYRP